MLADLRMLKPLGENLTAAQRLKRQKEPPKVGKVRPVSRTRPPEDGEPRDPNHTLSRYA